jgi:hypothetical protein
MRNREVATKDMVPTPATQGGHVPDIPLPDGALFSDDDDSFISNTESEGGFGGANADDNGSEGAIPNERAQGRNFTVDGEGRRRSTRRRDPNQRLVPGANNIQGYLETVWKSDADGSLEHFNLWTFQQGLTKWTKLNQDVFTLTLGSRQIPPQALVVYADDLIFWSRDVAKIDRVGMELCKLGVVLEQEDDAAGFLGVTMERESNTRLLEMK